MENINNISNSFYLLKKKIKDEDLVNLTSKSNQSIYNIIFKKEIKEEKRSVSDSPEILPDEEENNSKIKNNDTTNSIPLNLIKNNNNIEPLIRNLAPKNENKKEFEHLSNLNNLIKRLKNKLELNEHNLKYLNEINKYINLKENLSENFFEKEKYIKKLSENFFLIIENIFYIFKNEKNPELYLREINEIISILLNMIYKIKDKYINYNLDLPEWFILFKLISKYIYSIFGMKYYSSEQLKEILHNENIKLKSLYKMGKIYKTYMNSTNKLIQLIKNLKINEHQFSQIKQKLIEFFTLQPQIITYHNCFSIIQKLIHIIFEYLNTFKNI